ncbi:response regulator [Flammeovirga pectinis]|uniref:histidine kinase n=1 Tax=Flammeovirga pectinis TaxID=2494373 RepID=A0A3S9P9R9_9BACT|nr:two-component regulator propeller domain-containing protein [Flammeovirga pectinis]AZQ64883.1 response regulator [Flammeovirga pectinis]
MYSRLTLFLFSLIFVFQPLFGQEIYFSSLSMRDGLPSNIIADITQDKYGFLWVATRNGLTRYDGNEFTYFRNDSSEYSLPSNELTSTLAIDETIWVGSWNGLSCINNKTLKISRVDLPFNKIRTICKGEGDILWVGSANGLIEYNTKDKTYKVFDSTKNLSHNMVRSILLDKEGNVWVGTFDGINLLEKGAENFKSIPLLQKKKSNLLVLDIKEDRSNTNLWVGTEKGLFSIDKKDKKVTSYLSENNKFSNAVIKEIYQDRSGKLFLGTDFGLNIFSPKAATNAVYFHNPRKSYSITNNAIRQIFEDRNGTLWFSTLNGISTLNTQNTSYTANELSYRSNGKRTGHKVKSILVDSKGNMWFATTHGVIRKDVQKNKEVVFSQNGIKSRRILMDNVSTLMEDKWGRIWMGTASGISIWDENKNKITSINVDSKVGLQSNYIGNITQQKDGTIWVSAWEGGIYKIEGDVENLKNLSFKKIKNHTSDSEKFIAFNNNIWLLDKNKLFRVDDLTLKVIEIEEYNAKFKNSEAYSLYNSGDGNLWIGTLNGIIQYSIETKQTKFYAINTRRDEIVRACIKDKQGTIWGITNLSIVRLNAKAGNVNVYPLKYTLPIKNFHYGCVTIKENNEILFGGDNGYVSFYPKDIKNETSKSAVLITGLEINNKKIGIDQEVDGRVLLEKSISFINKLILNYDERSFTINFSSLDFSHSIKNIYAYKLKGFDENWHQVSGIDNKAIYSKVKPGEYIFSVKSINNLDETVAESKPLSITIKRPFFLQNIFLALYLFLILGIVFTLFRMYTNRLKLESQLHITQMEVLHSEELEKTKEDYFTNISHELRTPISLILPPLHQLQKKAQLDGDSLTLLNLAEKNAKRLKKLVNQILDFNKMQYEKLSLKFKKVDFIEFSENVFLLFTDNASRKGINYTFNSEVEEQILWVDVEKMETILFNLLSNAFKFTKEGGTISFVLTRTEIDNPYKEGGINIKISDTGIGISEEDQLHIFDRFYQAKKQNIKENGSGIGLTLVAEFVELHYGQISIESKVNLGTSFTLDLPLGTDHLPVDQLEQDEIELTLSPVTHHLDNKITSYKLDLNSDKPLLLLVDDNQDIIAFIRNSLKEKYNLIVAENGQEGVVKANRFLPQLIISDIMMPVMDGLSFTDKVKKNPKTSAIPIILLTAKSLPSQKVDGLTAGADIYLTKPIEIELLEAYIKKLLTRKIELEEHFKEEIFNKSEEMNPLKNEDTIFVNKVMQIIEANISNTELSVEMISQELSISTTHLYRKLKATTNHTAKDVIKKHRLKKASQLLQNREGNITEIVDQVGFSSLSYFSRVFKAEFKISPKKYQEKFNSDNFAINNQETIS